MAIAGRAARRAGGRLRVSAARASVFAALLLASCGARDGEGSGAPAGLAIVFEEVASPGVFAAEGLATADGAEGAGGLWASVPGLARAETGEVRRADGNGPAVRVALFRGGGGIRLSSGAGRALGLGPGESVRVTVTALRREPRLIEP